MGNEQQASDQELLADARRLCAVLKKRVAERAEAVQALTAANRHVDQASGEFRLARERLDRAVGYDVTESWL